jgi:hypothetical protein
MDKPATIGRVWLTWISHIVVAAIAASVLSVVSAYLWGWASMHYFAYEYPHDGQGALGVVAVALMAGLATWVLCFSVSVKIQRETFNRRRVLKVLRGLEQKYSITGRRV